MAPNLERCAPRSPYAPLSEQFPAVAARLVDKCRAELLGQSGSYEYNCPLDRQFFAAAGLEAEALRQFIATGADDNESSGVDGHECENAGRKDYRVGSPLSRESAVALSRVGRLAALPLARPRTAIRANA